LVDEQFQRIRRLFQITHQLTIPHLLWVSVKPIPGICLELPAAIQARVPEALLVADRVSMPQSKEGRWPGLLSRLLSRSK
jgi:hypothetical protein